MNPNFIFLYVAIGLAVSFLIIRWVLDIDKRNKQLHAQTKLLSLIAEKQGVAKSEIDNILKEANF